ncbi:hypothetical protein [Microbulbifer sp. SSSA008]|uniref:hypothetical protein n=1 Tax=unclassified Microbulbifer TaxID=2619833 RepID=UPI0040393DE7
MKPSELNKEARIAFGKTLIDISIAVFKGIILLFTVIPITIILNNTLSSSEEKLDILRFFTSMNQETHLALLVFILISFWVGHSFRRAGLKHIHEANVET